jgi:DNA-binding NtrC family response regulator
MGVEPPARVWIVDGDQWPRASLRAELIERGYDAVGFVTLREALIRLLASPAQRPDAIVIDLREQLEDPRPLAAIFGQEIPVIAIAGGAEAAAEGIQDLPWAAFLRRPVTIGDVAESLRGVDSHSK